MIAPWLSTLIDDVDDFRTTTGTVVENYHGFKQYIVNDSHDVCLGCKLPYTNKSDGMLCPACRNLLRDEDFT